MKCGHSDLIYTITTLKSGSGKKPLVRLTGKGWPQELGIDHIQFGSQRAAAYFAQHHAGGRPATLRLLTDGFFCGERPIPPRAEIAVPASHEDTGADFLRFFLTWPATLLEEQRRFAGTSNATVPLPRFSKAAPHAVT